MQDQAKTDAGRKESQRRGRGIVAHRRLFVAVQGHRAEPRDIDADHPALFLFSVCFGDQVHFKAIRLRGPGFGKRRRLVLSGLGLFSAEFADMKKLFF